ncbi:Acg family FMN-binding oxidoreductase [Saccharopolyspora sp. MS10]|uniref:Acg family FMN-binding oxidoreductase n=1 Tax=Saccharopolyspora sp. MS10 TaxID=3385973 RepID=UPI0039A31A77
MGDDDSEALRLAAAFSARAPSLYNARPWRWEVGGGALRLLATGPRLPAADPAGREVIISCGAALHHAVLALAALGRRVRVRLVPDAAALAVVEPGERGDPSPEAISLLRAAWVRRTDRRQYAAEPVPAALLDLLTRADQRAGVAVVVLEGDDRYALTRSFAKAAFLHGFSARYRDELAAWTGLRSAAGTTGVHRESAPEPGTRYGDLVLRDFGRAAVAHEEVGTARNAGNILLVSTAADDDRAHLMAGEATSAVLCTAVREGLATSPLSEGFEIDSTRATIRDEIATGLEHPQLAVRVGWPPDLRPPPPAPDRTARELLSDFAEEHG